jgi:hypothetical protein
VHGASIDSEAGHAPILEVREGDGDELQLGAATSIRKLSLGEEGESLNQASASTDLPMMNEMAD